MMADNRSPGDSSAVHPRPKLVVIAGSTATGKTRLGVELARQFGGEVVNADSRYLYRGFNIGTAKPSLAERQGILHHLIDLLEPGDDFSLARYQDLAYQAISEVSQRSHLPLLVGGTPLYINAVVEGWRIPRVAPQPAIRARLESEADSFGIDHLAQRLAAIDPPAAQRGGVNLRRIIRALEIHEVTGQRMSDLEGKGPRPYDTLEIGLHAPRYILAHAIDARVEAHIKQGLLDEVRGLLGAGVSPNAPAFSSIGYRQLLPSIQGDAPLEEAIEQIKRDTRRYVRHQETWLRANQRLARINSSEPGWIEQAIELVRRFLTQPDPDVAAHGSPFSTP